MSVRTTGMRPPHSTGSPATCRGGNDLFHPRPPRMGTAQSHGRQTPDTTPDRARALSRGVERCRPFRPARTPRPADPHEDQLSPEHLSLTLRGLRRTSCAHTRRPTSADSATTHCIDCTGNIPFSRGVTGILQNILRPEGPLALRSQPPLRTHASRRTRRNEPFSGRPDKARPPLPSPASPLGGLSGPPRGSGVPFTPEQGGIVRRPRTAPGSPVERRRHAPARLAVLTPWATSHERLVRRRTACRASPRGV